MKHQGSLEDLETHIRGCGFNVQTIESIEHGHRISTAEGAIVNWYPSTGTISIQGKPEPKRRLEEAWAQYAGVSGSEPAAVEVVAATVGGPANKKVS